MRVGGAATGAGLPAQERRFGAYQAFARSDWAWEFLRRHRCYHSDWRATIPDSLPPLKLRDGTTLLRLRRRYPLAERWGLYAFADPSEPAREALVFWLPTLSRRTARARCQMARHPQPPNLTSLSDFHAQRSAVIDIDGNPVISMKGHGFSVTLVAPGWHLLTCPALVTFELEGFAEFAARVEGLGLLRQLVHPTTVVSFDRLSLHASRRLHQTLIALDGSLLGHSYREIATAIFGARRAAEGWNASNRSLKDTIRRLVAKGHQLMNGGYRNLLR
jgi:hypothetical protein